MRFEQPKGEEERNAKEGENDKEEVEEEGKAEGEDDEVAEKEAQCRADVGRMCGKYGIALFEHSRLSEETGGGDASEAIEEVGDDEAVECPEFDNFDLTARLAEVTDQK